MAAIPPPLAELAIMEIRLKTAGLANASVPLVMPVALLNTRALLAE